MEPIGLDAGTSQDSLNQFATNNFVDNYQHMFPYTELGLFRYFSKELLAYNVKYEDNNTAAATTDHRSRSFIAIDFGKSSPILKAYFIPIIKVRKTEHSTLTLVSQTITKLTDSEELKFPNYDILSDYLQTSTEGSKLEVEMLSIYCVPSADSRLKMYLRSQSTSFNSIRANMTLDGKLEQTDLAKRIAELETLWSFVLLPARGMKADEELPDKAHRTAGILYYYDIRYGVLIPTPRLYIPVRHYGINDTAIVNGLLHYLKNRGKDEAAGHYLKALQTA